MFEWVRMRVGFYGSTPSYCPVFEQHGWEDLGHKLNDMSKKGQWEQMTQEVSDDIVHEFCAVGRFDQIADKIRGRFSGAVDVIAMPDNTPSDLLQELRSC
jgi:hypothetical protein